MYLADKVGKLLAKEGQARYAALEWTFFNIGGTGPMLGQLGYFAKFAKESGPRAIERKRTEANRLFKVLDTRLGASRYLVGAELTIADIVNFTWPNAARAFSSLIRLRIRIS